MKIIRASLQGASITTQTVDAQAFIDIVGEMINHNPDSLYPDQFLPLQRDMIGKFGAAKDQWFSSFLLQVENHSSWHRLFVDPLSRAMYSSDGPDFEFVQQKRKEGLSIHEAVWQLAWKKSGPEMASLEAWLEEHEKYRSVA